MNNLLKFNSIFDSQDIIALLSLIFNNENSIDCADIIEHEWLCLI